MDSGSTDVRVGFSKRILLNPIKNSLLNFIITVCISFIMMGAPHVV